MLGDLQCDLLSTIFFSQGLCTSFLTQLSRNSYPIVESTIIKNVFKNVKNIKSFLGKKLTKPSENTINVQGYWIELGSKTAIEDQSYVLTSSVKQNLKDLARVVAGA